MSTVTLIGRVVPAVRLIDINLTIAFQQQVTISLDEYASSPQAQALVARGDLIIPSGPVDLPTTINISDVSPETFNINPTKVETEDFDPFLQSLVFSSQILWSLDPEFVNNPLTKTVTWGNGQFYVQTAPYMVPAGTFTATMNQMVMATIAGGIATITAVPITHVLGLNEVSIGSYDFTNGELFLTGFLQASSSSIPASSVTYIPTSPLTATNVQTALDQVAGLLGEDFYYKQAVKYSDYPGAYANDGGAGAFNIAYNYVTSSGIGDTLTGVSNGALIFNGNSVTVGMRLLLAFQGGQLTGYGAGQNGIWVVTQVGSISTPYILMRSQDFNTDTVALVGSFTVDMNSFLYMLTQKSGLLSAGSSFMNFSVVPANVDTVQQFLIGQLMNTGTSAGSWKQPVVVATAGPLPSNTYSNGVFGLGATLTGNVDGPLTVDGYTFIGGERVLVKDEAAQANNGIYVVTQQGVLGVSPYILTRAGDFNTVSTNSYKSLPTTILPGSTAYVIQGTTWAGTEWTLTNPTVPATVGTTPLIFAQSGGSSGFSGYTGKSGFSGFTGVSGFSGFTGASGFSGFTGKSGFSGFSGPSGYSGFSGPSGYSGFSGPSGYSGFTGNSGYSGFTGTSGFSGFSGPSGYSGFSGPSGYSGFSGPSGYSGFTGQSGFSGFSGPSGYSGFSGQSGYSGFSGPSGYSGFSGPSGYSGFTGQSGYSGFTGQSGYSGFSGPSGYSGFSGPSGYSGFSGPSGYSGFSGPSGYSGFSGPSGYSGFTGQSGYSGFTGQSGYSGFSGQSGYSGFSGPSGYSGFSGPSGYSGFSGPSGYSGFSGPSGYSGFSGPSGYSGFTGQSGYSGFSGPSGYSGFSGPSGYSGFSGPSGYSGFSGPSGYSGFTGLSGYSGFSGPQGTSGFSGFSGPSGYSGFSGPSGYSGFSGPSGYSGFSGPSGYSGFSGPSGYSGFTGLSGYSGFTGLSGYSGFSGISGFSGFSGKSGYSGFCGLSGYSGFSGANPGASGFSGFCGLSGYSGFSGKSGYSGFCGQSGYSGFSGISGFSGYSGLNTYTFYFAIQGAVANGSIASPPIGSNTSFSENMGIQIPEALIISGATACFGSAAASGAGTLTLSIRTTTASAGSQFTSASGSQQATITLVAGGVVGSSFYVNNTGNSGIPTASLTAQNILFVACTGVGNWAATDCVIIIKAHT